MTSFVRKLLNLFMRNKNIIEDEDIQSIAEISILNLIPDLLNSWENPFQVKESIQSLGWILSEIVFIQHLNVETWYQVLFAVL